MLKAVNGDDEELGLILEQRKSRRIWSKISWMSTLLQLNGLPVGAILVFIGCCKAKIKENVLFHSISCDEKEIINNV